MSSRTIRTASNPESVMEVSVRADDNTTFHAKGVAVWVCVIASGLVGLISMQQD